MSTGSTFVCGRCERQLPRWKEVDESGLCTSCNVTRETDRWATDTDAETTLDDLDSGPIEFVPGSSAVRDDEQQSAAAADEPAPDEGSAADSAETDSTASRTGNHVLDLEWTAPDDFSAFDEAVDGSASVDEGATSESADALDRKIDSWKEQLLDLTRRSNLVDFSATKSKSLPFHRANPVTITRRLFEREPLYIRRSAPADAGGDPADPATLDLNELASTRARAATEDSLYQIELNQKRFQRERGVDSLFLSLGTLRWFDVDQRDTALRTPLFLVRVDLEEEPNRDTHRHDYQITTGEGELRVNPALRKMLSTERGLTLPPDSAFDLEDIEPCFAYIEEVISGFDRWYVAPEVFLGIFDFSKFGLYSDLEENRQVVKTDPFVQALNGDPSQLPEPPSTPSAADLDDQISPAETFQVLDADSSQQEAIEAAKRGMSFVLQGPPGTGKSQTISNIIAEKMAAGETVLFVSEKQAALDVVKTRLDNVGLGRFCLEAHGEKANKKSILDDLGRELQSEPLQHPSQRDEVVAELAAVRSTLNEYQQRLFYTPERQETTAYDAFGIVANRDNYPTVTLGIEHPVEKQKTTIDGWIGELETLASYEYEFRHNDEHPWRHTTLDSWRLDTTELVTDGLETAQSAVSSLQAARTATERVLDESPTGIADLRAAESVCSQLLSIAEIELDEQHFDQAFFEAERRLERLADLVQESETLRATLSEQYDETIFGEDGAELHDELRGYGLERYVSLAYLRLKRRILAHATDGYAPGIAGLQEDVKALKRLQSIEAELAEYDDLIEQLGSLYQGAETDWEAVLSARKTIAALADAELIDLETAQSVLQGPTEAIRDAQTEAESALDAWGSARADLSEFIDVDAAPVWTEKLSAESAPLDQAPLADLERWLEQLRDSTGELQTWIQYRRKRAELFDSELGPFLEAFIDAGYPVEALVDTFERNFYRQWLHQVYDRTDLDSFSATEFDELIDTFRQLDRQQREYAKAEIQHRVTTRRPQTELEHASSAEQVTLRREIQKSRRHMPLRKLFAEAPSLITDLKPCFMMSPLSVAQYLEVDAIEFDTVIFDEASQIMPQDAVSSLIRGNQAIIAGDSNQLPPTSFFNADVATAEDVRQDLESILDEASTVLPEKRLLWHYRSETNDLIEFSNAKYYNGALQTFPDNSPEADMGVEFDYVEDGLYERGGSRRNEPEARRVLELIQEHVAEHADRSLGVVAFSAAQAEAIRDLVHDARDEDSDLDAFVSEDDALEEFFVKSLENVQGDERDSLIFSIGYGPDEDGDLTMNFGPLNESGGERRLNVAVTRAKKHIQVVSSTRSGDIDLQRTGARGVRDFKQYLAYAERGGQASAGTDSPAESAQFDSEFEEAVYTALESRGFDVVTQVESSGYSVDLAIVHPDEPDTFLLGIECDGAAYRHSKTARDRDRTRQAVLESLGWTIHRIWAPDWTSNKERELSKIEEQVDEVLDGDASMAGGGPVVETDPVDVEPIPPEERPGIEGQVDEWTAPDVSAIRDRSLDDVATEKITDVLAEFVAEYGPIQEETAFRTVASRWEISRLGKRAERNMNMAELKATREGTLVEHEGFLWPGDQPDAIPLRQNTDEASRSIEEIPLTELAYAGYLILEAGTSMTREDLILEIARLFEYQRIGSTIKRRSDDAVSLLVEEGCAKAAGDDQQIEYVDVDGESRLLERVYAV